MLSMSCKVTLIFPCVPCAQVKPQPQPQLKVNKKLAEPASTHHNQSQSGYSSNSFRATYIVYTTKSTTN
uniref:Uncharacterized protein n=1 Tax=Kalanchoe fedtschenkoi TaxID=63787 RepID=A0A7N0T7P9_KALFE